MHEKFHGIPPVPINKGKLVRTAGSPQLSEAFLFEFVEPVPFGTAWDWQKEWQKRLIDDPLHPQAVWLLQHSKCYTLGRGATEKNLLFDVKNPPCELFRIDRGGEVTHHLPGQLVAYLVFDLHRYKTDLNWYLRELEELLLEVLGALGLKGKRWTGLTGIWIEDYKVGAIGISCKRWVTQHGLSLNIDCDLTTYEKVVPCGLADHKLGRLSDWLPGVTVKEVQLIMKQHLERRFHLTWTTST